MHIACVIAWISRSANLQARPLGGESLSEPAGGTCGVAPEEPLPQAARRLALLVWAREPLSKRIPNCEVDPRRIPLRFRRYCRAKSGDRAHYPDSPAIPGIVRLRLAIRQALYPARLIQIAQPHRPIGAG